MKVIMEMIKENPSFKSLEISKEKGREGKIKKTKKPLEVTDLDEINP